MRRSRQQRIDRAGQLFASGSNCAQSVLTAWGPEMGLSETDCLGVAAAFGGGVARRGETCGAVVGALMTLGLALNRSGADKHSADDPADEFLERFKALHGALDCRELLGVDSGTAAGRIEAQEHGLYQSVCPVLVADAVRLVG